MFATLLGLHKDVVSIVNMILQRCYHERIMICKEVLSTDSLRVGALAVLGVIVRLAARGLA